MSAPSSILHPPSALAALEAAAAAWSGTPFCENSAVKGAGVCCHAAVAEVYFEAGIVPRLPYPFAPIKSVEPGRIQDWFATPAVAAHFRPVTGEIQPGDTLVFRAGRTCHFMLALPGGRFFHALEKTGAGIAPNLPPKWRKRLIRVWRPIALSDPSDPSNSSD